MKKSKHVLLVIIWWVSASIAWAQPGTLDVNFDGDGKMTIDNGANEYISSVALQADQKIIVAGYEGSGSVMDFSVGRLNPDGSSDNTFGTGGFVSVDVNSSIDIGYEVHVQPDGKILLTGVSNGGGVVSMALIRLNADGVLDPTFGNNGIVISIGSYSNLVSNSSELLSDGKILVAGYYLGTNSQDLVVGRFNSDGSVDNTFSFDGFASYDIGGNSDIATVVRQQADGKILVGGKTKDAISNEWDLLIVRFTNDGLIDQTFGTNGRVTMHMGMADDECNDIRILGDGKIMVAGTSDAIFGPAMALAKLNPDGSLDTQFGNNGYVTFSTTPTESDISAMIVTPDNRIVVVGFIGAGTSGDFAIARRNADGSTDSSFGTNGGSSIDFNGDYDRATHVVMQDDGLLLAVGYTFATNSDIAIARYISGINIGIGEVDTYLGNTLIYPNPIIGQTAVLEYELAAATSVAVTLTSMDGKQIAEILSSSKKMAGKHSETVMLPKVASGNYLLNVQTPAGHVAVRLMID